MENKEKEGHREVTRMTSEIVAAYVGKNRLAAARLPSLICSVWDSLMTASQRERTLTEPAPEPAVPVRQSVRRQYIVCLEDGRRFRSLTRHLRTAHGLDPDTYRARWGLRGDYPMAAPGYAAARADLAKRHGLGTKAGRGRKPHPAPEPDGGSLSQVA